MLNGCKGCVRWGEEDGSVLERFIQAHQGSSVLFTKNLYYALARVRASGTDAHESPFNAAPAEPKPSTKTTTATGYGGGCEYVLDECAWLLNPTIPRVWVCARLQEGWENVPFYMLYKRRVWSRCCSVENVRQLTSLRDRFDMRTCSSICLNMLAQKPVHIFRIYYTCLYTITVLYTFKMGQFNTRPLALWVCCVDDLTFWRSNDNISHPSTSPEHKNCVDLVAPCAATCVIDYVNKCVIWRDRGAFFDIYASAGLQMLMDKYSFESVSLLVGMVRYTPCNRSIFDWIVSEKGNNPYFDCSIHIKRRVIFQLQVLVL